MDASAEATLYLAKAEESLASAESDFAARRYNSCANRCYYACFQAAIAALLQASIRPSGTWGHDFVDSQFVGLLINRRKLYPTALRPILRSLFALRATADYRPEPITRDEARRAVQASRQFVHSITTGGA